MIIKFVGTVNYLKRGDPNVWHGASTLTSVAPPWYSPEFYLECVEAVQEVFGLDLNRDIDVCSCSDIYNYLVGSFE